MMGFVHAVIGKNMKDFVKVSDFMPKCINCCKELSDIRSIMCKSCSKMTKLNPMWKGDNVGYSALHEWIKSRKPKPPFCEFCKQKPPYDLANISGEYKRNIDDYLWVCRKCHMKNDDRIKKVLTNLKQFKYPVPPKPPKTQEQKREKWREWYWKNREKIRKRRASEHGLVPSIDVKESD
jgi:hypothetical protein